jgi:molybdate transport system ATP-binding protein
MSKPIVSVNHIAVRQRDRWLLDGLSWQINESESWAVIGPNGAGKTTLAKAIAGLLPVVKGKIHYHDFGTIPPADAISYMASDERRNLWRRERGLEHRRDFSGRFTDVTVVRDWIGAGTKILAAKKEKEPFDIIQELNLNLLLEKPIMALSTGEMSRVFLARELFRHPKLLILDEPFDGIDKSGKQALREKLDRLASKGLPIVLITHRPEEMLASTTHVLTIGNGKIIDCSKVSPLRFVDKQKLSDAPETTGPARLTPKSKRTSNLCPTARRPVVEMEGVSVRYADITVLDKINWTVREGEHWAVTGPNGAGKSTLLKLITGDCLQVYANKIRLFGKARGNEQTLWEIRQKFSVVSHELATGYQKQMTAFDVVCSGFFDSVGLYRDCDKERSRIARKWMDRLDLSSISQTLFNHLSQGQRQMLLIARAMVKVPRLLILDEPCAGLDPDNRRHVLQLADRIAVNGVTGLIFITHHEEEIPTSTTHRLVLDGGVVRRNWAIGLETLDDSHGD